MIQRGKSSDTTRLLLAHFHNRVLSCVKQILLSTENVHRVPENFTRIIQPIILRENCKEPSLPHKKRGVCPSHNFLYYNIIKLVPVIFAVVVQNYMMM